MIDLENALGLLAISVDVPLFLVLTFSLLGGLKLLFKGEILYKI